MFKPGSIYRVVTSCFFGSKDSVILITSCESALTAIPEVVSSEQKLRTVMSFLEKKEDSLVFEKVKVNLPLIESEEDMEFWMQNLEPLVTS